MSKQVETEEEVLAYKRKLAKKYLPKLKELLDTSKDQELKNYVQIVVDGYMLHECKLGRAGSAL